MVPEEAQHRHHPDQPKTDDQAARRAPPYQQRDAEQKDHYQNVHAGMLSPNRCRCGSDRASGGRGKNSDTPIRLSKRSVAKKTATLECDEDHCEQGSAQFGKQWVRSNSVARRYSPANQRPATITLVRRCGQRFIKGTQRGMALRVLPCCRAASRERINQIDRLV